MQRIDILWRDIPSQVLIKRGRDRGKYMLSARFQEAIDRAAMRADKGGSDAYLEEWRRVTTTIEAEGALEEIAEQLGREIETGFSDEQLAVMVKPKGFAEISPCTRCACGRYAMLVGLKKSMTGSNGSCPYLTQFSGALVMIAWKSPLLQ